jgi:hypothetical protein
MPGSTRQHKADTHLAAPTTPGIDEVASLAWTGRHEQALERAGTLLASKRLTLAARVELLDLRAESRIALGHFDAAHADALAMQAQAELEFNPAASARALCRMVLVQTRQGLFQPAADTARLALAAARLADDRRLEAMALFRQSEALWRTDDDEGGLRAAQQAAEIFAQLGDAV